MTPFVADSDFTLYVGDAAEVLRAPPAESVHCVVTSPPYWGLRDYGTPGQLGLEATPEAYVESMVAVFREVRRVLRRDGTCWLNLGDSYAQGHGGSSTEGNYTMRKTARGKATNPQRSTGNTCSFCGWEAPTYTALVEHHQTASGHKAGDGNYLRKGGVRNVVPGLKPKDLCGIPWRVAFALQADGWYLRSDIIWSKPNPMPESVTDRPTKAHEYLFLLTRSARYFYDADAIREPWSAASEARAQYGFNSYGTDDKEHVRYEPGQVMVARGPDGRRKTTVQGGDGSAQHRNGERWPGSGRNKRSVWEIATEPYPDAHFATFPQALVEPCVKAGTSERGCCPECGAPWVRETLSESASANASRDWQGVPEQQANRSHKQEPKKLGAVGTPSRETLGWSPSCHCFHMGDPEPPTPVPCTVLDPFMGSGTTALVARKLGRRSIGIELNPEYARLAADRLSQLSLLAEGAA